MGNGELMMEVGGPEQKEATPTKMTINREIKDVAFVRKRDISPGIVLKKARRVMVMEKRKVVLSAAVITWRLIANNRMCVASAKRKVTWPKIVKNRMYVASVERKDTKQAIVKDLKLMR